MSEPEAQLIIGSGPAAGTTFVIPEGVVRTLGSHPQADHRLPDLLPRHGAVRYHGVFEVQGLEGYETTSLNGQRVQPQRWMMLRPGDELSLGPYVLRVELLGLDASTMIGQQSTRRLAPEISPPGYELLGRLGGGGFGNVYTARRRSDGKEVALKVLKRQPNASLLSRFNREFEAGLFIKHPNVVQVIERGVDQVPPYVAMELIAGPSADDLLRAGPMPVPQALRISLGIANALAHLATLKLVHRDIKPANVLVAEGDVAKLADFGLVKDMEEVFSTLTATGQSMGTLAYAAPEQLNDAKSVDPLADVYSLGATIYHLISGRPPFIIKRAADFRRVFKDLPPPLQLLRPECPPVVAHVAHQMLAKEPRQRPTAAAVVAVLEGVVSNS